MWFESLVGFREGTADEVRASLELTGSVLKSRANGRTFACGIFEMPSLGELRQRVAARGLPPGMPAVREIVADVQALHVDASAAGAMFQVASQFNLLEMVHPSVSPEDCCGRLKVDHLEGVSPTEN